MQLLGVIVEEKSGLYIVTEYMAKVRLCGQGGASRSLGALCEAWQQGSNRLHAKSNSPLPWHRE